MKYALNIALKEEDARNFLLEKLATIYPSIEEFIETFYISVEELKDMADYCQPNVPPLPSFVPVVATKCTSVCQ